MSGRRCGGSGRALQAKPAPATRSRVRTTLQGSATLSPTWTDPRSLAISRAIERNYPTRSTVFFADVDPPQNLAPSSDEILGIEWQMIPEKVKRGDRVTLEGRRHLVKRWDRERLIAESRCAAFFVSPVSPKILKPGSPLQRGHPVLVDRAREHADPHPYMDKDPVSRVEWGPRRGTCVHR
jgi:hypothetical protein